MPELKSAHAAGFDLSACLPRGEFTGAEVEIKPGEIQLIPTGIAAAVPIGHEGQVRPRSGLATKFGLTIPNAPGTIDADYRGEWMVGLMNLGREPVTISHGDRIAQVVIAPVTTPSVVEVDSLEETERGSGGFGSTGR